MSLGAVFAAGAGVKADTTLLRYVDPFIGTTNFGTTNPGALVPNGLMSVSPFNVTGSELNRYDKDAAGGRRPTTTPTAFSPASLTSISAAWDAPNWGR